MNKDFTPTAGVRAVLDKWAEGDGLAYGCDRDDKDGAPGRVRRRRDRIRHAALGADSTLGDGRQRAAGVPGPPRRQLLRTLFFGIIYVETRDKVQAQIISGRSS